MAIALLGAGCSDDEGSDASVESGGSSTQSTVASSDDSTDDATGAEGDQAVAIVDYAYDPEELTVKVGTTVTFTNKDDFDHTATTDDLDTGDLGKGDSGDLTFDEVGTVEYHCSIHNYMKGSVEVVE